MEIAGLLVLGALVLLGAPVWVAIVAGTAIALIGGGTLDPLMLPAVMHARIDIISLTAVPLFIFAGEILYRGGAVRPLIDFLNRFLGHIPGGPAYVVIVASAVFATMSSSSLAAVAGFGPILIPMMTKMGYSRRFAIGLLVASATLGPTIPPSVPLIFYGYVTQTSVKDLYTAAFVPGALLVALLALTVFIHTRRGHYQPPPRATREERWQAVKAAWPVLLMPVIVIAPIYIGLDTPTEAAGVAAVYSLFLATIVYKGLTRKDLWETCTRTGRVMATIFVIVMVAYLLNLTLLYMRIPFDIMEGLTGAGLGRNAFMGVLVVVYFIMGAILDPSSIMVVTPPILMPTIVSYGISPVLYGIVIALSLEIASITPPYGITLFAATRILDEDFGSVARACFMFYPALIVGQLLVVFIPQISLFLLGP